MVAPYPRAEGIDRDDDLRIFASQGRADIVQCCFLMSVHDRHLIRKKDSTFGPSGQQRSQRVASGRYVLIEAIKMVKKELDNFK